MNDDDNATAAIVIATSPAESLPHHVMDKLLASAPQPDFKRTLPGVVVKPPELAGDTMVGLDSAALAPDGAIDPAHTAPIPTSAPVVTFTHPSGRQGVQSLAPIATPGPTLPPPLSTRTPAQPLPAVTLPLEPKPDLAPKLPELPIERSGLAGPRSAPEWERGVSIDTQPQPAYSAMPSHTLPPGEAPPIIAPIIAMSARREQPQPAQLDRRGSIVPWLAAAACLVIAGGAVVWALQRETAEHTRAAVTPTSEIERKNLIAVADTSQIRWTATQDPIARGVTGDLVWNPGKQTGFMRFVGLLPNDPKQLQYQLWIFDKTRDQAFPVDGGVFDVSTTGEVIVKISAKLAVTDASRFEVTVEKPGGVVVSKRERIVVTAARS